MYFQTRERLGLEPYTDAAFPKDLSGVAEASVLTKPTGTAKSPDVRLFHFAKNSTKLKDFHVPEIDRLADQIAASWSTGQPIRTVYVKGHASSEGSPQHNVGLGNGRALTVRKALQKALERKQKNLSYKVLILSQSKGAREPFATDATEEGKSQNRRVEVFLSTKKLLPKRTPALPLLQASREFCLNIANLCADRNRIIEKRMSDCGDDRECILQVHKLQQAALDECAKKLLPCEKLLEAPPTPRQLAFARLHGWLPQSGSNQHSVTRSCNQGRARPDGPMPVHGIAGVPGAEWADWCTPCIRGRMICHSAGLIAPEPPECIGIFGRWYNCRC